VIGGGLRFGAGPGKAMKKIKDRTTLSIAKFDKVSGLAS
jgi:hypothetical protein